MRTNLRWTTPRRPGAGSRRAAVLVHLSLLTAGTALPAQVGYPPSASPYTDIPRQAGPFATFGYWTGGRGIAEVGITNALIGGVGYELPVGGPFRAMFSVSYGRGERYVVDPTQNADQRRTGPYEDSFLLPEGEVQLLLTGHKTWHRLAPYVSLSAGFLLGGAEPPADTSDYSLGNKLVFGPAAGVRWYPAGRLHVLLDARLFFLKLRYPSEFFVPGPDGVPVLRFDQPSDEWIRTPRVRMGIGWTF